MLAQYIIVFFSAELSMCELIFDLNFTVFAYNLAVYSGGSRYNVDVHFLRIIPTNLCISLLSIPF
jgi:hypothetical protein